MSCTHPYGKNIKKSVLQDIKNLKTPFDQGGVHFLYEPSGGEPGYLEISI